MPAAKAGRAGGAARPAERLQEWLGKVGAGPVRDYTIDLLLYYEGRIKHRPPLPTNARAGVDFGLIEKLLIRITGLEPPQYYPPNLPETGTVAPQTLLDAAFDQAVIAACGVEALARHPFVPTLDAPSTATTDRLGRYQPAKGAEQAAQTKGIMLPTMPKRSKESVSRCERCKGAANLATYVLQAAAGDVALCRPCAAPFLDDPAQGQLATLAEYFGDALSPNEQALQIDVEVVEPTDYVKVIGEASEPVSPTPPSKIKRARKTKPVDIVAEQPVEQLPTVDRASFEVYAADMNVAEREFALLLFDELVECRAENRLWTAWCPNTLTFADCQRIYSDVATFFAIDPSWPPTGPNGGKDYRYVVRCMPSVVENAILYIETLRGDWTYAYLVLNYEITGRKDPDWPFPGGGSGVSNKENAYFFLTKLLMGPHEQYRPYFQQLAAHKLPAVDYKKIAAERKARKHAITTETPGGTMAQNKKTPDRANGNSVSATATGKEKSLGGLYDEWMLLGLQLREHPTDENLRENVRAARARYEAACAVPNYDLLHGYNSGGKRRK